MELCILPNNNWKHKRNIYGDEIIIAGYHHSVFVCSECSKVEYERRLMEYTPETDGVDHINIYSKGKTELGRLLTNLAHTPFTFPLHGSFSSVESFWYYAKTGFLHPQLKPLYGFRAKEEGKKYAIVFCPQFEELILEAIRCKLRQHKRLRELLTKSTLPLTHYYVYGTHSDWKVIPQTKYNWQTEEISRIRSVCQEYYASEKMVIKA